MRFLAHVHGYAGVHSAGAERYLEALLEFLVDKGHDCKVLTASNMGVDGEVRGGVTLDTKCHLPEAIEECYKETDYVITHLDLTPKVIELCRKYNKKLIYIVHNYHSIPYWEVQPGDCWMVLYNAEWMEKYHVEQIKFKHDNTFTLIPPTNFEKFHFKSEVSREDITLVNLNMNKGVLQFIEQAKQNPQYSFRGVIGAYGDQKLERLPNNIKLINHTKDIVNDVFKYTKILMMPSLKETWGMAAIEAMCSGIPVIAHPTEGLLEACGDAGLFALRDKTYVWKDLISMLMENKDQYNYWSEKALSRAKFLYKKAYEQLEELEKKF